MAIWLVVNFWGDGLCSLPDRIAILSNVARAFLPQGVVVVAISGDEDAETYRRFLSGHRVSVETYRDPTGSISESFGTYMFPQTYIIQHGRMARKVEGPIDWTGEDIASFVRTWLARK